MSRWHFLALAALAASPLQAQDTTMVIKPKTTTTLALSDAVATAREKNPDYRIAQNQVDPAKAGVRNAWGQFIPFLSTSIGAQWQGGSQVVLAGVPVNQPSVSQSNYNIGLDWSLSGPTFYATSQAKANQRAVEADVMSSRIAIDADVVTQYLNGMQAAATTEVARQQVRRNYDFLLLTTVRNRVGQASMYDVRQAEVAFNSSEVDLLRSLQAESDTKIELFRRMGVNPPAPVQEVALADSFTVRQPEYDLEALLNEAKNNQPRIKALEARQAAAEATLKSAKSAFFPTLSAFANKTGFTNETSADTVSTFPFHFTSNPILYGVQLSLPIFQGFNRTTRISRARADQMDASERLRAIELQIRADVTSRLLAVNTAWRTQAIQDRSRTAAAAQLTLANERYRLGSGTVLELSDALNAVTRADAAYINAVYDNHRALVALYASIGRDYTNARN
jgi:outer membrane protein